MRRMATALGCLAVTGALATPAAADAPVVEELTRVFTDVDPCTGDDHEITKHYVITTHQHGENTVIMSDSSGSTDSGYEMTSGLFTRVFNDGATVWNFTDVWENPNGNKFVATGRSVLNLTTGEWQFDEFKLDCKSGSTLTE